MKAVFNVFQKQILKLVRPAANSVFNFHNPKGIKYVTRPRLRLTHLREHKSKHSFQAKKNNTLVSGNAGDEKIFTRAAAKIFFYQFNWIFTYQIL